jgi:hypothetical protein
MNAIVYLLKLIWIAAVMIAIAAATHSFTVIATCDQFANEIISLPPSTSLYDKNLGYAARAAVLSSCINNNLFVNPLGRINNALFLANYSR